MPRSTAIGLALLAAGAGIALSLLLNSCVLEVLCALGCIVAGCVLVKQCRR